MDTRLSTKRILIFLAFAIGVPWTAALVIYLTPMMKDNPLQAVSTTNLIFISTPWLANLFARLVTREGWRELWLRPNFKRGWKFYLAVWLLPLLATIAGGAVFFLLFPHAFDPNLGGVRKLVEGSPSAAADPWVILLSVTLSTVFVSSLINMLASMGEEFGWRAYLLPKLKERFDGTERASASAVDGVPAGINAAGARKAALLTGLIHGVWHWPLIVMSMSVAPGVTWLTPLVYLVFTCSLSILLSWGTLRSGSVWPAALGHGAANGVSALPGFLLSGPAIPLVGPDPTGLIGGIGYIVLALVLLFNRRTFAWSKEARSEKTRVVVGMEHV